MSQKAEEGWIEWNGGECPIKDARTTIRYEMRNSGYSYRDEDGAPFLRWTHDGIAGDIIAYRIIEAHGADAEPARPTPWPQSYADLVFTDDGWSQTIIVDGNRPEWLRDDDRYKRVSGLSEGWPGDWIEKELAIRVRRREPKRETVRCWVKVTFEGNGPYETGNATIDLIDGKPDLSTLKIGEGAL